MSKTKYLVGTFIATALLSGGCFSSAEEPAPAETTQTQKLAGQRLTDDSGVEYTLIDNGDGTETARYDDGRSVTFRRQEDGSLDFMSGTAGLLAGMAAGYFLFHGFNSPAGNWDASRNRYTVSEPLQRTNTPASAATSSARPATNSTTTNTNSAATNSTTTNTNSAATNSTANTNSAATNSTATTNSTAANSNSKVNLSKDSAASSTAKSGFGSAGARGGSSAAS